MSSWRRWFSVWRNDYSAISFLKEIAELTKKHGGNKKISDRFLIFTWLYFVMIEVAFWSRIPKHWSCKKSRHFEKYWLGVSVFNVKWNVRIWDYVVLWKHLFFSWHKFEGVIVWVSNLIFSIDVGMMCDVMDLKSVRWSYHLVILFSFHISNSNNVLVQIILVAPLLYFLILVWSNISDTTN